ncbi:hypothetical protein ACFLTL_00675 [Chloroflexota bacterium]
MPESSIISGFTYLHDDERLLDILNGAVTRRVEGKSKSLEMVDVEVRKPDGQEERRATSYINKPAISLAATWEENGGRGIFTKNSHKEYPYVEKVKVPVHVQLSGFSLIGNMHLGPGQMASHLLEEQAEFLPMTNVKVQPLINDLWSDIAFLAVNRRQVLSLEQEDVPLLKVKHGRG